MELYARRIQEWQHDLGLSVSSFDNIGMSSEDFLSEIAKEEQNNNQVQQEEVSTEYSDDYQYERERLTDSYSEYLRD
jgi:hypothetical protein